MNDTNGMFICKNCDAEVDAAECIASGRFTCPSCGKQADLYVGDGPTATGHVQARKHPIIFLAMHKGGMYHLSNREYDLYVTAATLHRLASRAAEDTDIGETTADAEIL